MRKCLNRLAFASPGSLYPPKFELPAIHTSFALIAATDSTTAPGNAVRGVSILSHRKPSQ